MDDLEIKEQVRQFYNQVGWQMVGEGIYQNARYEDLRPVSSEYIKPGPSIMRTALRSLVARAMMSPVRVRA